MTVKILKHAVKMVEKRVTLRSRVSMFFSHPLILIGVLYLIMTRYFSHSSSLIVFRCILVYI